MKSGLPLSLVEKKLGTKRFRHTYRFIVHNPYEDPTGA